MHSDRYTTVWIVSHMTHENKVAREIIGESLRYVILVAWKVILCKPSVKVHTNTTRVVIRDLIAQMLGSFNLELFSVGVSSCLSSRQTQSDELELTKRIGIGG